MKKKAVSENNPCIERKQLNLLFAREQCRQLEADIKRREATLAYRYPVYKLLVDADTGRKQVDYERLLSAAENSGAYKSWTWFAMYLAIARRDVWRRVAALLCETENGGHDLVTVNDNGSEGLACRHCGYKW